MNSAAEPCVVPPDPARCAYASEDGKEACGEECLVAKGRRDAEFKVDIFRGRGTVVRVTHLPSGMVEQIDGVHGQYLATKKAKAALRLRLGYAEDS